MYTYLQGVTLEMLQQALFVNEGFLFRFHFFQFFDSGFCNEELYVAFN